MSEYELIMTLKLNRNEEKATAMAKYMRNKFEFLGLSSPERKTVSKPYLTALKTEEDINWDLIEHLWNEGAREFQYVACDYLFQQKKQLKPENLSKIKDLALTKPWWDTIDSIDRPIAFLATEYPEINNTMLEWSTAESIWLRRIAIIHQRLKKGKTDVELLEMVMVNNLNQTEFFINKGIGWALRSYSKTNPEWVSSFIDKNRDGLSTLSIREGSKYL